MQVPITSSTNQIPHVQEYFLEGGVKIRDKTQGMGKAILSAELTDRHQTPVYHVLIHGKKLIFPTCPYPSSGESVAFMGSRKITFKQENGLIKIKEEVDESFKRVLYVNPKKVVDKVAYDAYSYPPMKISLESAMRKIQYINTDFPNFKEHLAAYNCHGVAVFGWDKDTQNYALYWANPHEEKVKKMECSVCESYPNDGSSLAKSKDGSVNFRYLDDTYCFYLNSKMAKAIRSLESPSSKSHDMHNQNLIQNELKILRNLLKKHEI